MGVLIFDELVTATNSLKIRGLDYPCMQNYAKLMHLAFLWENQSTL